LINVRLIPSSEPTLQTIVHDRDCSARHRNASLLVLGRDRLRRLPLLHHGLQIDTLFVSRSQDQLLELIAIQVTRILILG